jgi:hypothetical protein
MGQSPSITGLLTIVAALSAASMSMAQSRAGRPPGRLDNPYGWPCPPGYEKGRSDPRVCTKIFVPAARQYRPGEYQERIARVDADAARSAPAWLEALAKRKESDQEANQEAARRAQEVERERLKAREAEAEQRAADARKHYAEDRQRAAEARRKAAEAAVQEKGRAAEASRKAAETAAAAKRLADEEDRRATEAEQRAAEAEQRATAVKRRAAEAEHAKQEAEARKLTAQREAEARERQRRGIFGEEDLSNIVNAADHNTVRFETYYKGKTFSGVGAFKQAGKANLGIGNSLALHIAVRNSEIVCFIDKSKAHVVADWQARTRLRFTGTIGNTALLGETLQLENCTVTAA